jgi:hypothetical protein
MEGSIVSPPPQPSPVKGEGVKAVITRGFAPKQSRLRLLARKTVGGAHPTRLFDRILFYL